MNHVRKMVVVPYESEKIEVKKVEEKPIEIQTKQDVPKQPRKFLCKKRKPNKGAKEPRKGKRAKTTKKGKKHRKSKKQSVSKVAKHFLS